MPFSFHYEKRARNMTDSEINKQMTDSCTSTAIANCNKWQKNTKPRNK